MLGVELQTAAQELKHLLETETLKRLGKGKKQNICCTIRNLRLKRSRQDINT